MVNTLYGHPISLAAGAIGGVIQAVGGAIEAQNPTITLLAVVLTLIAAIRLLLAMLLPRIARSSVAMLELLFEIGAFSFALVIGSLAAMAIYLDITPIAKLVLTVSAYVYAVGIAARNAGRPAIAIGQFLLSIIPILIALVLSSSMNLWLLAFSTLLLIPAMMSITINVFKVISDSIAAADTSARLAERMQILARTDVVTGLLNRAGLNHHLIERVMAVPADRKLAILWLDLDRFKEVNDTLGHQVGDRVLSEIGRRLQKYSPAESTVARFGGDEFIVAFEAADRKAVQHNAQELLEAICKPFKLDHDRIEIGGSIGIALLPDDGADLEAVMRGADLALYHSKVNGRKQINNFNPSMTRDLLRRREIEAELRQAIQRDELSIFFQPLVDLKTGRIRAFEALVRWFHPEKGELKPDEFIPVAEESGAIITLGNWITLQAAKAAVNWPDHITLAVNLSPVQIKAPGAALGIMNALHEAKLPAHRLELEVTETVLVDHNPTTDAFMEELCAAGVRFALDDFGTGYSSLGYLNRYPFSKIKIDRSFVSGENAGNKSDAIIRAVSEMGVSLGMEIVAEGIETIEQVQSVRKNGCTLGQGYYFSRAVPDYQAILLLSEEADIKPIRRKAA